MSAERSSRQTSFLLRCPLTIRSAASMTQHLPPHRIPNELWGIKAAIDQGERRTATVRKLLSWFGVERRKANVVDDISATLRQIGLRTVPNFEEAWIDAPIGFFPTEPRAENGAPARTEVVSAMQPGASRGPAEQPGVAALLSEGSPQQHTRKQEPVLLESKPASSQRPVTAAAKPQPEVARQEASPESIPTAEQAESFHRIGALASANKLPLYITPDTTIQEAVTLMLHNNYSQLPVMTSTYFSGVHGIVSWTSIGRLIALGRPPQKARDCIDSLKTVSEDDNIFDVARDVARHSCVLVVRHRAEVLGFVTSSDLTEQFGALLEPFLLVGDIESQLRALIGGRLSIKAVRDALGSNPAQNNKGKQITSAADLTLGEYQRVLERDELWKSLQVPLDRALFIKAFDQIRETRNDVMHFNADGVSTEQLQQLRNFATFLRTISRNTCPSPAPEAEKKVPSSSANSARR